MRSFEGIRYPFLDSAEIKLPQIGFRLCAEKGKLEVDTT